MEIIFYVYRQFCRKLNQIFYNDLSRYHLRFFRSTNQGLLKCFSGSCTNIQAYASTMKFRPSTLLSTNDIKFDWSTVLGLLKRSVCRWSKFRRTLVHWCYKSNLNGLGFRLIANHNQIYFYDLNAAIANFFCSSCSLFPSLASHNESLLDFLNNIRPFSPCEFISTI